MLHCKGGMNMNKLLTVIAGLSVLAFGLMVAGAHASEPMSQGWSRSHEVTELIGKPVRNSQGEYLGRVKDFVFDPNGRVTFAIVSYGTFWRFTEKSIAVPFEALTYNRIGRNLMVNMSKEKFESAPRFTADYLSNQQKAEDVYRYFGLQPYWTEGASSGMEDRSMGGHNVGKPMKEQKSTESPYDYDYMWR